MCFFPESVATSVCAFYRPLGKTKSVAPYTARYGATDAATTVAKNCGAVVGCLVVYVGRFGSNCGQTTPGRRSHDVWNGTMRFGATAMGIAPGGKGGPYFLEICRFLCLQAQLEGRVSPGYRPGMPGMRGHNGQHECY